MLRLQSTELQAPELQASESLPTSSPVALCDAQPWRLSIGLGLTLVVVFGLLGAGCYYVLHRRVLPLLASLRNGLARLSRGESDRIPVTSGEVSGATATAVNQLADQLAASEEALQRAHQDWEFRLQERTAALAAANAELRSEVEVRRAAELALVETETKYRALVEQMPAITYTAALGSDFNTSYISPQVALLGFTPEEWVNNPGLFLKQLHPDDHQRVTGQLAQIYAAGQPVQMEYRLLTRDGRMLWISDQAHLLYDGAGQPIGRQGLLFDITQRKAAEEALHDSVRRIELIADNLPALIAYIDDQQVYRFANRQFEEWYATPDIVGRDLWTIAGDQQYQGIRDYVDTALAGTPITFDYARIYPDGQQRFVEIAYIPHVGPEERVLGFFTLVQDVTERKVAEEQVKASLEEKVVLLKEIHHRVKNNLQVISSLLSLQSEQIDNPQVRASLQDSQNRVRSMALIHEKLYQAQDQVRVDVAEYIQNLTSYLFRSYATLASGIQLKVKVDNVYLGIDAAMPCGLIINELLSNALKHAFPHGAGGEVYVDLRHDADGLYTLLVGDTGVGMPADLVWYKSASLGLQLVHTLVKQLDGTINVRRDHGVEFCICFSDTR